MELPDWPVLVLIAATFCGVLNVIVTWSLIRDRSLDVLQKLVQGLIAWTIPFIGGAIVLALQGHNHSKQEMKAMVPFPFYLLGYSEQSDKMIPDRYGHSGDDGFASSTGEGCEGGD